MPIWSGTRAKEAVSHAKKKEGQREQRIVKDRTSTKVILKVEMLDASVPWPNRSTKFSEVKKLASAFVLAVWSKTMDAQVDDTVHWPGCRRGQQ